MPAVSVRCPHCSHSYSVDGSLIGRKGRCKHCGNSFELVPSTEHATADSRSGVDRPTNIAAAVLAMPDKIGRFLIGERLGAGAAGAVYRAVDPTLDRDVALKVPHPEFQRDQRAMDRFLREAKAAASLHHPHIIPVYEAGVDGETSYIASAFIAGRTLAAAALDGPFESRRAARIIAALADALQTAHELGIIHRDVKPANVLLDADDQPHLTDFGLARLAAAGARLTKVGSILGTPAYLAPEQAEGRSDQAGAASDQYSLGVTLYELLSGQVPFAGPLDVIIFHTLHTPPPRVRDEHPDVPVELEMICLKALAKKPGERYASCRDLANDLGRWLAGRPTSLDLAAATNADDHAEVSAPGQAVRRAVPTAGPTRRRLPRRWAAVAAVAGMLIMVLGGLRFVGTSRDAAGRGNQRTAGDGLRAVETKAADRRAGETTPPPKGLSGEREAGNAPAPDAKVVTEKGRAPSGTVVDVARTQAPHEPAGPASAVMVSSKSSTTVSYEDQMSEVQRALAAQDVATARRALASCPVDSRGWEWHFCERTCELIEKSTGARGAGPGSGVRELADDQFRAIRQAPGPLSNVAFSPDGTIIATTAARYGGDLILCDAATGAEVRRKRVSNQPTWALAFSPDGKRIATGSTDATVRIWNATTLALLRSRTVHARRTARQGRTGRLKGGIESVAFSPDGRWIASAGDDGTVRVCAIDPNAETRADLDSTGGGPSSAVEPSRTEGQSEAKAGSASPGKDFMLFREQDEIVYDVAWDRHGRWIASGGASKIKFWDLTSHQIVSTIDFLPRCLAPSPDGRRIAATSMEPDPTVKVWDVETRQLALTLKGKTDIADVDFSPDGKRLATVGRWNVQIWDATTGRQLLVLGEPREESAEAKTFATAIRFSTDGRRIASVMGDLLRVWSIPATGTVGGRGVGSTGDVASRSGATAKQPPDLTTKPAQPAER